MGADLTLAAWLDRVAVLAGYADGSALVAETGTYCWMDYYNDEYTPEAAWSEENSQ